MGPKRDEVAGSGENYIMRSLIMYIVHQYYSCDQIKKNEMGGARSTYGREERFIQDFGGETLGIDLFEDLCEDGSIILKWIFRKWGGEMDWIDLAEDRDRWRALENAVMNLRVP
jgi:hypothetical protein